MGLGARDMAFFFDSFVEEDVQGVKDASGLCL